MSDRFLSETLSFIIHHRTARLNERTHALMKQYRPHLLSVFFQSSPGQEMEFKHSIMEFTVKPSFFVEAMVTLPHLEGLDQLASMSSSLLPASSGSGSAASPGSNLMVKSAVINFRRSTSASVKLGSQKLTVTSFFEIHDRSSAQRISSDIGELSL